MLNWWLVYILDEDDNEKVKGKIYGLNIVLFKY